MREIKLTRGLVAFVDDEDFYILSNHVWRIDDQGNNLYARSSKGVLMHRMILGLTDKKILVDHKDRNGLNNIKSNLRIATRSQNNANTISRPGSSSKYLGVCFYKHTGKWAARIRKNGKLIHIGQFETEENAAIAYNKKAIELHGEFANLNKVFYEAV